MNQQIEIFYQEIDTEISELPLPRRKHEQLKVMVKNQHDLSQAICKQQAELISKLQQELDIVKKEYSVYKNQNPSKDE